MLPFPTMINRAAVVWKVAAAATNAVVLAAPLLLFVAVAAKHVLAIEVDLAAARLDFALELAVRAEAFVASRCRA